jgi:hypothetical protein
MCIIQNMQTPPSVTTFELMFRDNWYRDFHREARRAPLWRDLDRLLATLVDHGVQTISVKRTKGSGIAIRSCNMQEKAKLRELFPILLDKKVLVFA